MTNAAAQGYLVTSVNEKIFLFFDNSPKHFYLIAYGNRRKSFG